MISNCEWKPEKLLTGVVAGRIGVESEKKLFSYSCLTEVTEKSRTDSSFHPALCA